MGGPLRILLVDDEPDIRTVAELALSSVGGHNVSLAEDASSALALLETVRPDLILLDVMMPGMDGPELLELLQKRPGGVGAPVVFLTAKVQAHEIARLKGLGAAGVLPKPFDPMTLADQLEQILQRQLEQGSRETATEPLR